MLILVLYFAHFILAQRQEDIPNGDSRVQYAKYHDIDEFMTILDRLPSYLEQNPKVHSDVPALVPSNSWIFILLDRSYCA